jgi:signal transduction histidine kinase
VKVTIHCEDEQTHLDVKDNGIGFDINDTSLRRGLGLNIMQERVEKIGGQLTIAVSAGKGTTVSVRINNT